MVEGTTKTTKQYKESVPFGSHLHCSEILTHYDIRPIWGSSEHPVVWPLKDLLRSCRWALSGNHEVQKQIRGIILSDFIYYYLVEIRSVQAGATELARCRESLDAGIV